MNRPVKRNFIHEAVTLGTASPTDRITVGGGGFFRLYEADAPVLVVFKNGEGHTVGKGTFESGEWVNLDFEQITIINDSGASNAIRFRVSPEESGSDSVQILSGTEADPLFTMQPFQYNLSRNIPVHTVANNSWSGFFLPPSATGNLAIKGVLVLGVGSFDLILSGASEATIIAEGPWVSGAMEWSEVGTLSGYDAYRLNNDNTSAVVAAGAQMGPVPVGQFFEIPHKPWLAAGSSMGVVVAFKNTSGVAGQLGLQLVAEEI